MDNINNQNEVTVHCDMDPVVRTWLDGGIWCHNESCQLSFGWHPRLGEEIVVFLGELSQTTVRCDKVHNRAVK